MVKVTYGHGVFNDCDDATDWTAGSRQNMAAEDVAISVVNDDYIKLSGTLDDASDESFIYDLDFTNISSDAYTYYLLRWKTDGYMGLRARLDFSSGQQYILGEDTPQFSTEWTVTSGTVTSGKTVKWLRLYVDDYPDSTASGSHNVYVDFFMICKGTFTLPNTGGGVDMDLPPREAILGPPSRDADITQNLGTESVPFRCSCDLTRGTWKRSGDYIDGEVFWDIWHNRSSEPWQWLDTEAGHQFKTTVHPYFYWAKMGKNTERRLDIVFREYSRGDKSDESYIERYGLNL